MRPLILFPMALLASLATAALTGCTTDGSDATRETAAPTPRPTMTSEPAVEGYVPPTGECVDGEATLTADVAELALPDGCETVNVLTNGSTINLGPVTTLTLEGADNTVTVADADEIHVYGDQNAITHGGDPEIDDHGEDNTLTAR